MIFGFQITTDQRKSAKEPVDLLKTRTGGAYIPPAKLKMMQEQITDQNSEQYQRINWERLKKKIHGTVNYKIYRIIDKFQFHSKFSIF